MHGVMQCDVRVGPSCDCSSWSNCRRRPTGRGRHHGGRTAKDGGRGRTAAKNAANKMQRQLNVKKMQPGTLKYTTHLFSNTKCHFGSPYAFIPKTDLRAPQPDPAP